MLNMSNMLNNFTCLKVDNCKHKYVLEININLLLTHLRFLLSSLLSEMYYFLFLIYLIYRI